MEYPELITIGKQIREICKNKKISIKDLCDKLDYNGFSFNEFTFKKLDEGILNISIIELAEIARSLEVPLKDFFKEDEKNTLVK